MADDNLEKIYNVLGTLEVEIAKSEVHMESKVEKADHVQALADLETKLTKDFTDKYNTLMWKVALLSGSTGVAGGAATWMATLMMKGA